MSRVKHSNCDHCFITQTQTCMSYHQHEPYTSMHITDMPITSHTDSGSTIRLDLLVCDLPI